MPETLRLAPAAASAPSPFNAVELAGHSPAAARLQELVRRAASTEGGVLVVAEEGVLADDVAAEVHAGSRAAGGPFITIDCAVDAPSLDRHLFGATPGDG